MNANQVEAALRARWRRYPLVGLVAWPMTDPSNEFAELRETFRSSFSPWHSWPHSFLRWMISELHGEDDFGDEGLYAFLDEKLRAGPTRLCRCLIERQQKEIHEFYRALRHEMFVCDTATWEGPHYFVNLLKFHAVSPARLASQLRVVLPKLKSHPDFLLLVTGKMSDESERNRMGTVLDRISRDLGVSTWHGAPIPRLLADIPAARPLLVRAIRHMLSANAAVGEDGVDFFGFDSPNLSWLLESGDWSEAGATLQLPPLRQGCTWWLEGVQIFGPEFDELNPQQCYRVEVKEGDRLAAQFNLTLSPRACSLETGDVAELECLYPGEYRFLFCSLLSKNGQALHAEPVLNDAWACKGFKSSWVKVDPGDRIIADGQVLEVPRNYVRPPRPRDLHILSSFIPQVISQWPVEFEEDAAVTLGLELELDKSDSAGIPKARVPFRLRWKRRGRPVSEWGGPYVYIQGACMSGTSFRGEGIPWSRWLRIPGAYRLEAPGSESLTQKGDGWWLMRSARESQDIHILNGTENVTSAVLSAPIVKWRLSTPEENPAPEWQTAPLRYRPESPWSFGSLDIFFDHQSIRCEFIVDSFPFKMSSNREGFIRIGFDRLREFGVGTVEGRSLFIRNKDICLLVVAPIHKEEPAPLPQQNEIPPEHTSSVSVTWMPRIRRGGILLPGEHRETVQLTECGARGSLFLIAEVAGCRFVSNEVIVDLNSLNEDIDLCIDLPDATVDKSLAQIWFEFISDSGERIVLHPCGEPFVACLPDLQGWFEALLLESSVITPLSNRVRLFRALTEFGRADKCELALAHWHECGLLPRVHLVNLIGLGNFSFDIWQIGLRDLQQSGPEDELDSFWIIYDSLTRVESASHWAPISGDWCTEGSASVVREIVRGIDGGVSKVSSFWNTHSSISDTNQSGGIASCIESLAFFLRGWVSLTRSSKLLPMGWESAAAEWDKISTKYLPSEWSPGLNFLKSVAVVYTGKGNSRKVQTCAAEAKDFIKWLCTASGLKRLTTGPAADDAMGVLVRFVGLDDKEVTSKVTPYWSALTEWLAAKETVSEDEAATLLARVKDCARGNLLHVDHIKVLTD